MNRQLLLERQYELVSCLVANGPLPDGMSPKRLQLVRRGLANKRRREAISSWPALEARLGNGVFARFDAYAATHQRPPGGSPLLDGYAFCQWLAPQGIAVAAQIVAQCRPLRDGVEPRPVWQRHGWRLRSQFSEIKVTLSSAVKLMERFLGGLPTTP